MGKGNVAVGQRTQPTTQIVYRMEHPAAIGRRR